MGNAGRSSWFRESGGLSLEHSPQPQFVFAEAETPGQA
jgi:hypothetical protein